MFAFSWALFHAGPPLALTAKNESGKSSDLPLKNNTTEGRTWWSLITVAAITVITTRAQICCCYSTRGQSKAGSEASTQSNKLGCQTTRARDTAQNVTKPEHGPFRNGREGNYIAEIVGE